MNAAGRTTYTLHERGEYALGSFRWQCTGGYIRVIFGSQSLNDSMEGI